MAGDGGRARAGADVPAWSGAFSVELAPDLADLADVLRRDRAQLERELGTDLRFDGGGSCTFTLRTGALPTEGGAGRLVIDREAGEISTEAPDRAGLFEVLSLLRDVHRLPSGIYPVRDCADVGEAVDRIEREVGSTWPSFERYGIDWKAICARWRPRVLGAEDPIAEMQAWLAELGDAHTWVRPAAPQGRLPYAAEVRDGEILLSEVPRGTVGFEAGARAGQRLRGLDAREILRRTAASAHSRAAVAGLRALQGPVGTIATLETDLGARWEEAFASSPWPEVVSWSLLPDGTGFVRIRQLLAACEVEIDAALAALRGRPLVMDLRGNGGGNLAMAHRLRDRFLRDAGPVGTIRYSHPRGGLTDPEPILARPAEPRWDDDVVFLVDALTYSASEDLLLGLHGQPGVRVLGRPTGGGSGRVRTLRLTPGWRLTVSTALTYTLEGRCIEGSGIPVDGPLPAGF